MEEQISSPKEHAFHAEEAELAPIAISAFNNLTSNEATQMQSVYAQAMLGKSRQIDARLDLLSARIRAIESGKEFIPGDEEIQEDDLETLKGMWHSLHNHLRRKGTLWHDLALHTRPPDRAAYDIDDPKVQLMLRQVEGGKRLPRQCFLQSSSLPTIDEQRLLILQADRESAIELPAVNFITAEGFVDWERGRGPYTQKTDTKTGKTLPSSQIITDYATRPTAVPPVDTVVGYIQPDGQILYHAVHGAHRAAAMLRQGKETILARSLTLMQAEKPIILPL